MDSICVMTGTAHRLGGKALALQWKLQSCFSLTATCTVHSNRSSRIAKKDFLHSQIVRWVFPLTINIVLDIAVYSPHCETCGVKNDEPFSLLIFALMLQVAHEKLIHHRLVKC